LAFIDSGFGNRVEFFLFFGVVIFKKIRNPNEKQVSKTRHIQKYNNRSQDVFNQHA
jgi:hypothetical protein